MARPDAGHERVYRGLLRLYPAPFRAHFADDMVQLFRDQLRDAHRGGAPAGAAGTWLRTLADLAVTAASEHVRRDRTVAHSLALPPSVASRALGILGVVGGLVLVAAFVIGINPDTNFVRIVLFNLGAIAIVVAIQRRRAPAGGMLAMAIAGAAILANGWSAVMTLLPVFGLAPFAGDGHFVGFLAEVAMWLADAAFGLVIWRTDARVRWIGLALAIGSLFALTGIDRLELVRGDAAWFFSPAALAGVGVNGLAWILLGIDVATRRRPATSASTSSPEA